MKKQKLIFYLLLVSHFVLAQDLIPYKGLKGWYLYDKSKQIKKTEAYQNIIPTKSNVIFIAKNNKWSAITRKGVTILDFKFDAISLLKNGLIKAHKDDIIKLYTQQGELISKQQLLEAADYKQDSTLIVAKDEHKKFGVISVSGKLIMPFKYNYAPEHVATKYLKVGIEDNMRPLYGLLNTNFETIIPVKYREIQYRYSGYFLCTLPEQRNELIDSTGKVWWAGEGNVSIINKSFLILNKNEKDGIFFRKTGKTVWVENTCFINTNLNLVICRNDDDNLDTYYTADGEKIFFDESMDETSNNASKKPFDQYGFEINETSNKYVKFSKANEEAHEQTCLGFYDVKNNKLIKFQSPIVYTWSDEIAVIGKIVTLDNGKKQQKFGVINIKTLDTIVPLKNNEIRVLKYGFAVKETLTWKLYNNKAQQTSTYEYTDFNSHDRSMADTKNNRLHFVKRKEGKYKNSSDIFLTGYVNDSCKEIIPSKYLQITLIKNRYGIIPSTYLYSVSIPNETDHNNGSSALFNENFKPLTFFEYTAIHSYWNGYLICNVYQKFEGESFNSAGIMDLTGNEIVKPQYKEIKDISSKGFIAAKNGRMCFLNKTGKEIIPLIFERISFLNDTLLKVTLRFDHDGLYDISGKEYFKPQPIKIFDTTYLDGTLIKVEGKSKIDPNITELFYVDFEGRQYRD
jgi:hypothetical protein